YKNSTCHTVSEEVRAKLLKKGQPYEVGETLVCQVVLCIDVLDRPEVFANGLGDGYDAFGGHRIGILCTYYVDYLLCLPFLLGKKIKYLFDKRKQKNGLLLTQN
ncbi:MAG: hypothetical protein ACKO96_46855, partial [Flammeovirgaceae bacterium]